MSATNAFETALLALIFTNTNTGMNLGDAVGLRGSSSVGSFWISLHTGIPDEAGTQSTSEAAYVNYARKEQARNTTQWLVTGGQVENNLAITYNTAGALSSESDSHFGIGSAASSTGNLFLYGTLTAPLPVAEGITPEFAVGALDITLN